MTSKKYLLAIALGPVQDFIVSARRNRDLWFGSWLLSEISKVAAHEIHRKGGTLIFPSPLDPAKDLQPYSEFSVVNKILAEVETENLSDFCDQIYQAMRTRLRIVKDAAFKEVITDKSGKLRTATNKDNQTVAAIHQDNANKQIEDLVEFYWAAQPFDDASMYAEVRKITESLLAARKATRNFNPVTWGGNVPKSALDGLRESVVDEAVFYEISKGRLTERDARIRFGIRGSERLCGVGLLKRHGNRKSTTRGESDSFFSTSHVAALPLLNRLKDGSQVAVENYLRDLTNALGIETIGVKKALGHVPANATLSPHKYFCNPQGTLLYDGHLLFEERLREFCLKHDTNGSGKIDQDKFREAKDALSRFLGNKDIFGSPQPTPLPYYAILHADGDRMGAAIETHAQDTTTGSLAPENSPNDDPPLPQSGIEKHRLLSFKLSEFAALVRKNVEVNHGGSCVYAGGDDVLALVPLHTALACARDLADEFKSALVIFPDKGKNTPTLSVGIAIGHHLDPLQDTLELARQAEKIAKREIKGKNALAVTVSKRSGSDRTVKGSWNEMLPESALDHRLHRFVYLHLKDELPDGAAYELQDLAIRLAPTSDSPDDVLLQAQRAEAKRILKRKQPQRGKGVKLKDVVFKYLDNLIENAKLPIEALAEEVIVARLFADATDQAGITAEEYAERHGINFGESDAVNSSPSNETAAPTGPESERQS